MPEKQASMDALFGWSAATATSTQTPAPVLSKTITTTDKALAVDVPEAWAARGSSYDTFPVPGSALRAGTQIDGLITPTEDGLYLDASAAAPVEYALAVMTPEQQQSALNGYVSIADWSKEGCVPGSEPAWSKDGWLVAAKAWQDCAQTEGLRTWEVAALNDDATILVTMQIALGSQSDSGIVDRIVASFAVDESKLPVGTVMGDDATP